MIRKLIKKAGVIMMAAAVLVGFVPALDVSAKEWTIEELHNKAENNENDGDSFAIYPGDTIKVTPISGVTGVPWNQFEMQYVLTGKGSTETILEEQFTDAETNPIVVKAVTGKDGTKYFSWKFHTISWNSNFGTWVILKTSDAYVKVTTETEGRGTVKVTGNDTRDEPEGKYAKIGSSLTIEAVPEAGYEFIGWDIPNMEITDSKGTITVPKSAVSIKAKFRNATEFKINITGGTSWDMDNKPISKAKEGTRFTIIPDDDTTFGSWKADCKLEFDNDYPPNEIIMPAADVNITAVSKDGESSGSNQEPTPDQKPNQNPDPNPGPNPDPNPDPDSNPDTNPDSNPDPNALGVTPDTDGNYELGAGKDMPFTFSKPVSDFKGVFVDNKQVDAGNYEWNADKTVLTLKASYLEALSAGKHTVEFRFENSDSAKTQITIAKQGEGSVVPGDNDSNTDKNNGTVNTDKNKNDGTAKTDKDKVESTDKKNTSPKTGDITGTAGLICLLMLSVGAAGVVTYKKRRIQ